MLGHHSLRRTNTPRTEDVLDETLLERDDLRYTGWIQAEGDFLFPEQHERDEDSPRHFCRIVRLLDLPGAPRMASIGTAFEEFQRFNQHSGILQAWEASRLQDRRIGVL